MGANAFSQFVLNNGSSIYVYTMIVVWKEKDPYLADANAALGWGTRRSCEASPTSVTAYGDNPRQYPWLSKETPVFVEFSFVLLSFFRDRLGSSFKVLPLFWEIPDVFPLTENNWCYLVTFCTWVGSCSCFPTQPTPVWPWCSHPAPPFCCPQLTPSLFAWPGTAALFLFKFTPVFLFHGFTQPVLLFHSPFSASSFLRSPHPPSQASCSPSFPSHIPVLLDVLSHEFLSTLSSPRVPFRVVVSSPALLRLGDTQGELTPVFSEASRGAAGSHNYRKSLVWVWQSYKQI